MLEGVGRTGSYPDRANLQKTADQKAAAGMAADLAKRQSPQPFVTFSRTSAPGAKSTTSMADKIKLMRIAAIKRKLKNGEKLSTEDLGFLMKHNAGLYRKAKAVQSAREELEHDLRRAKTREEARQAMLRALRKTAGQAGMADAVSGGTGGNVGAMAAGGDIALPMGDAAGAVALGGAQMAAGDFAVDPQIADMGGATVAGAETALPLGDAAAAEGIPPDESLALDGASSDETQEKDANKTGNDKKSGKKSESQASGVAPPDEDEDENMASFGATQGANGTGNHEKADQRFVSRAGGFLPGGKNDDGGALPPTQRLMIKALRKAWEKFARSGAFNILAANGRETTARQPSVQRHAPAPARRRLEAALAYRRAANALGDE